MNRSARYRHRISFEEPVDERNSDGIMERYWQVAELSSDRLLYDVPAEVLTGAGREFVASGAKQAETDARINLRWFPGLLPTWRVVWGDVVYDITSIEMDRTGRFEYRLRCKTGLADGS